MSARIGADRASLSVVYLTVFLDLLGFGIILPALPFFARTLGASGFGLGWLFAAYSLAQLVGAVALGRMSDRFGRRPILLLSLAGSVVSLVACAGAQTLLWLCAARALAGLFGGSIATAQAYIADVTAPEDRARAMGLLGASIGLGFVLGPALGGLVLVLGGGFSQTCLVAAALAAANWIFGLVRLREPERTRGLGSRMPWRQALERPGLRQALFATFLTTFAFVAMETTFAYLGADRFGLDPGRFALVLVYVGLVLIVVQGALIGRVTRRLGVRPVAIIGGVLMAIALLLLPYGANAVAVLAALGGLAVGQGLSTPSLSTLVSRWTSRDAQGTVLGLSQSLAAGARATGPLIAGALYDQAPAAPYWLASGAALLAALLLFGVDRKT